MNKVMLMGRITRDLEMKRMNNQDKTAYLQFTIAINREYKNNNDGYDADFISCNAFGKTAEFVNKHFGKGRLILIEGSIRNDDYTDSNGNKIRKTKVRVEKVRFTGEKKIDQYTTSDIEDDDLPF